MPQVSETCVWLIKQRQKLCSCDTMGITREQGRYGRAIGVNILNSMLSARVQANVLVASGLRDGVH